MPPAVIAAGVGAVGAIGGAILTKNAQQKASDQAAASQNQATQAQLQLGQQSLAVQQQLAQQSMAMQQQMANQSLGAQLGIYNSNYDILSPYASRGNVAGDAINALLGLPAAPKMTSPMANGIPDFPGLTQGGVGLNTGAVADMIKNNPPSATGGTAAPMTLDQWATNALAAMAPNITKPESWALINASTDPMTRLNAALSISPPSSDQYPLYSAYLAANPKPTAPAPTPSATPTPTPTATPAPAASSTLQQQAQQAIAQGADPAAVNARLAQMSAPAPSATPSAATTPQSALRANLVAGGFIRT